MPHISLQKLTAAAAILPGLMEPSAQAAEENSFNVQYSHYQESKRQGIYGVEYSQDGSKINVLSVPNNRNPIEVDSIHGSGRFNLTDRIKFAFNYNEDTWSGATPIGSAPEFSSANQTRASYYRKDGSPVLTGASPYATSGSLVNKKGQYFTSITDPGTGKTDFLKARPVHVMSYASPESRSQGDFKLSYEWEEAELDFGGGVSLERDYESRFVNLGGRMDFNQKQTTVNLGLSYTNSAISANLDSAGDNFFQWSPQYNKRIIYNPKSDLNTIKGNRQDWATHVDLTQVINKNAVLNLGMGYTRSTGFLENPYKLSWFFGIDQVNGNHPYLNEGYYSAVGQPFIEQRPDNRNQWNWTARWANYIEPLDAAVHLGYSYGLDNWGINSHTFDADWVQPLGRGWTITPRVRYYSQTAANFYQSSFVADATTDVGTNLLAFKLPDYFSSDQRLSGYGTLSGGVTVSKQFGKGVNLETGFEYYSHQGGLKLGGGGELDFADFDYWVANAAMKVDFSALQLGDSAISHPHASHASHPNVPAGILFGHKLDNAGDFMVGYRYMRSMQAGDLLSSTQPISKGLVAANACPGSVRTDETDGSIHFDGNCGALPLSMTMNMHMLDLMYAPTDWLTLMLMPQFLDMDMQLESVGNSEGHAHGAGHKGTGHETGGIGDTGMYALINLFETPQHHIHTGLGISVPTGDVGIKLKEGSKNLDGANIHYGMQLGSGTWDFKPSLTYTGKTGSWSWGAQIAGTKRLENRNASGYALGDIFETSVWGGYDITHWLTSTFRMLYSWQGSVKGQYPRSTYLDNTLATCDKASYTSQNDPDGDGVPNGPDIFDQASYNSCLQQVEQQRQINDANDRHSPMDFPQNYGGHYVDIGLGLSVNIPHGAFAGNRLSFEWLQPLYTNVNGYQLDRDGALSFTWSYGF